MTDVAALIADMVRAGVDPDLIGRAAAALADREPVRVIDEQAERRRAADRERKRLRKSAESAEQNHPDKEAPQTPKEINPKNSPPSGVRTTPAKATPRSELLAVLDAEHAQDVIDHRNRIKKPMTAKAARGLARKLGRCPDPNAAADLMIEKGWQSIEPDWIENHEARARASPFIGTTSSQPKGSDWFDLAADSIDGQVGNSGSDTRNRLDDAGVPILAVEYHERERSGLS